MVDAHANFAVSTVAVAPSPSSSGTSLTVATGDGAKFPAAPFNATVWPLNTNPTTANAEIVRVTAVAGDVLTITRAAEAPSFAQPVTVGYGIAATITAKTLTDIEGAFPGLPLPVVSGGTGQTAAAAALGALGGAPKLVPTALKVANYTAVSGDLVRCNTTAGPFTVTLPAAPADGTIVGVRVVTFGAGNNLTVACGGSDALEVTGGATSATIAGLQGKFYQYHASDAVWIGVAIAGVTGIPNGGTNATTAAGALANLSGVAAASFDLNSQKLVHVADGSAPTDGATVNNVNTVPINNQIGTTYALALGDAGQLVTLSNASAITLTIPANASVAFPVGTQIQILQLGAGQVTVGITTDTLNATPGKKTRAQYSQATLTKVTATSWIAAGDLSA